MTHYVSCVGMLWGTGIIFSLSVPFFKKIGEESNTGAAKIILGMIGLTLLIGQRRIGA